MRPLRFAGQSGHTERTHDPQSDMFIRTVDLEIAELTSAGRHASPILLALRTVRQFFENLKTHAKPMSHVHLLPLPLRADQTKWPRHWHVDAQIPGGGFCASTQFPRRPAALPGARSRCAPS